MTTITPAAAAETSTGTAPITTEIQKIEAELSALEARLVGYAKQAEARAVAVEQKLAPRIDALAS